MEMTFECPGCRMIDHADDVERTRRAFCRHCLTGRELDPSAFDAAGGLAACPLCGSRALEVRRDSSQALALAILASGFVAALAFWYDGRPGTAYLALGGAAALDLILHRRAPLAATCPRCACQLRGPGVDPARGLRAYDPGVGGAA